MDQPAPTANAAEREALRLAALHALAVLDTPAEALLDGLVRSAAAACAAPLAMLNLVDGDRQWTKAHVGMDGYTQMPRAESICTLVVETGGYLEIPDTGADPRVAGKPCVAGGPRIGFYAGAPLTTPQGHVLGSLAVLDRAPRAGLGRGQREALQELARTVVQALLLRQGAHRTLHSSSEELFRLLSEACPVGIFHTDAQGKCIYTNPQWQEIFGLTLEQSLGDGWSRAVHPEDQPLVASRWQSVAATASPFDMPFRVVRPTGKVVHVRVRGRGIRLPDGSTGGYVGSVVDISEEVATRRALQDTNEFLARAEQIAGVGGWRLDLFTRELRWTHEMRRIFEVPADYQPTGDEHLRFFSREAQQVIRRTAVACRDSGDAWDLQLPMTTAGGRPIQVRSIGQIERRDGRPTALVGVLRDVTAANEARAALERSEERLQRALDGSGLALWDLDVAGERIYLSEQWSVMLGGAPRETRCTAQELLDLVPMEDLSQIQAALEPVLRGESARYVVQHRVRKPDGSLLWIHSEGRVAERHHKGAPLRMVGTNRDITQHVQAERDLREARDAADAASRAKSQFLATMSHEIRTPLNGIIGMTRLLLDEPLPPQVRGHADLIDRSAHSLLALVDDILDVSKIEAGQMEIERVAFDLHELLDDLASLYRQRAAEKSLLFRVRRDPAVPQLVEADPTRLRQVLVNLLGNALKFTSSGSIGMDLNAQESDTGWLLEFAVVDTGIGIPPEVQPELFTRFMQADSSTSRRFGGSGLGLSIVRQLVELMGGTVAVRSVPGQGSRFTVTLPVLAAHEAPVLSVWQDLPPPSEGTRVLIAEDNTTNQVVAFGMLRKLGYDDVSIANDGVEAYQLALEEHFDVILMDCQMPEMDGYEATRRLRAAGCTSTIVAMTANAIQGDRERCLEAGMNDYLTKPIDLRVLRATLAKWGAAQPPRLEDLPPFSAEAMHSRFGGDTELEQVALATFGESTPGLLARLRAAHAAGDRMQIKRLAHSARGGGSMISAERYAGIAGAIEDRAESALMEDLGRLLDELEQAFADFLAAVRDA